jgi:hypothetical protein
VSFGGWARLDAADISNAADMTVAADRTSFRYAVEFPKIFFPLDRILSLESLTCISYLLCYIYKDAMVLL